jgi:hypothetical protein
VLRDEQGSHWIESCSRRRSFGIRGAHFLQSVWVILQTSVSFSPGQLFDERGKALSPIVARARFNAQVVIEVAQMNDGGLNARTASLKCCVRAAMSVGSLIRFGAG